MPPTPPKPRTNWEPSCDLENNGQAPSSQCVHGTGSTVCLNSTIFFGQIRQPTFHVSRAGMKISVPVPHCFSKQNMECLSGKNK
eukprot:scaffold154372_cov17-Tisochrysis_lutea.AAC.1